MRSRRILLLCLAVLLAPLVVGCSTADMRPDGPDPSAHVLFYGSEIKPVGLHEGDVPLRVWVKNWAKKPFPFQGELVITSDGTQVDAIPFGPLFPDEETGKTVPVHQVCAAGKPKAITATIKYDPSITGPPDQVDTSYTNNETTSSDVCPAIYQRYLEDFTQQCVKNVNSLRALENLPPLASASEQQQACSNADAKANYSAGLGHEHDSMCGAAQNTCPDSTFASVLSQCIDQQMYQQEELNYQKDPNSCYHAAWPGTCGHYVNMTDKHNVGYTTLACGVFVTPSEHAFVVLNFFK